MIDLGKVLLFIGFISGLLLPIYIIVLCFRYNLKTGFYSLFIPFYPLYYIWREETRNKKLLILYFSNIFLIVIGTIIISF